MVAADALVVVACLVLIEHVAGQVEHPVVERRVGQDRAVGIRQRADLLALGDRLEHRVVQIALVDRPQVDEAQHGQQRHHRHRLKLAGLIEQQDEDTHDDDGQRAPAVGREHRLSHP